MYLQPWISSYTYFVIQCAVSATRNRPKVCCDVVEHFRRTRLAPALWRAPRANDFSKFRYVSFRSVTRLRCAVPVDPQHRRSVVCNSYAETASRNVHSAKLWVFCPSGVFCPFRCANVSPLRVWRVVCVRDVKKGVSRSSRTGSSTRRAHS